MTLKKCMTSMTRYIVYSGNFGSWKRDFMDNTLSSMGFRPKELETKSEDCRLFSLYNKELRIELLLHVSKGWYTIFATKKFLNAFHR